MSQKFKGEIEVQTGFGLPRHTNASRNAYTPSAKGYKVFDTDLNKEFTWTGSSWIATANTGDYVNLTTTQSISGQKTFVDILRTESNIHMDGDLEVGDGSANNHNPLLTINSSINGNPYLIFERVGAETGKLTGLSNRLKLEQGSTSLELYGAGNAAVFSTVVRGLDPVDATDFATLGYLENYVGNSTITNYVTTNTDQSVGGKKTFTGTVTAVDSTIPLVVNQTATNNQLGIEFQNAGIKKVTAGATATSFSIEGLWVIGKFCGFRINTNDVRLAYDNNEFQLGDDYALLTKGHFLQHSAFTSTDSRALVPKSYVDSKFVDFNSTQLIGGAKTFSSDVTLVGNNATLDISSTGTNYADDAIIELKTTDSGGTKRLTGKIYVDSSANALKFGKYNRGNGTTLNNQLAMYDTYSQFTDEVRGVTGSNAASFVTRSWVEDEIGDIDSVVDHGALTGLGDDDHSQYHTNARGDARYYTQSQVTTFLAGKETAFTKNSGFNRDFGTGSNDLIRGNDSRMYNARTPTAHTHTKSDITDFGSYVDLTNTQNIGGSKTFTSDLNLTTGTPYLDINSTSGNAHLRFQESGVQRGLLWWDRTNDRLILRAYADNGSTNVAEIRVDDAGHITSSVEHRGVDSATTSSFTTRGYVEGRFVPATGNTAIAGTKSFSSPVVVPSATADAHALNRAFADGRYVQDTGNTVISGTKAFTGAVTVPNSTGSTNALNTGTADARYVQDTGNTIISGTKTFTGIVKVPNSTGSTNALNTGIADLRYFRVDGTNESAAGNNTFTGTLNTFNNDVNIGGTLNVGETAFVENLTLDRTTITLNNYYSGSGPSESCGIIVNRGGGAQKNAIFRWNESSDAWEYGVDGAMNGFSSRAYAESKISRSGDWMYGDLGFRMLDASMSIEQQNGIFFREHGDNTGINFGGCFGKQFAGGGKRMYLAHMLGSTLNSHIRVDEENIGVEPTGDFFVYRAGQMFSRTGIVNSSRTHKMTMKAPSPSGSTTTAEIAFESIDSSGSIEEVRFASQGGMTSSYTMLLPISPPSAGQALTCQSFTGQVATLHWA